MAAAAAASFSFFASGKEKDDDIAFLLCVIWLFFSFFLLECTVCTKCDDPIGLAFLFRKDFTLKKQAVNHIYESEGCYFMNHKVQARHKVAMRQSQHFWAHTAAVTGLCNKGTTGKKKKPFKKLLQFCFSAFKNTILIFKLSFSPFLFYPS